MSLDKIHQLIGSLAKKVEDSQKIATPILAVKLAKCLESYPHDQTIGAMSRVISKMASNNTTFISKADLKSLYTKLHSRNTKFAELFADELGVVSELPEVTKGVRDDSASIAEYQVSDPVLANALHSVFDKTLPVKMYSQDLANKALSAVATTLDAWNLKPSNLSVEDGNDKFLAIKAEYETPKGKTSFYVPIETSNNKIAEASVFMGNSGPQELNNTNIKSYITSFAGQKLRVAGSVIVGALTKAASENREISDAELALTRLNANRQGKSEFFQGQIIGQKVAEASVKDVELPKYDEFVSFEKSFSTPQGVAAFTFGADKVKTARDSIARDVIGFGYKGAQITVTGSDDNTIFYGVSLDAGKVAFTVPVKIAGGKINKPNVLLCNGSVSSFSKDGINQLYVNNQSDFKVAAAASPQFNLKPSDLLNNIRKAVADGNLANAEDALNVLANSGDEKAYAVGFDLLVKGLANKNTKTAETQHTCSLMIKNATSEHPICGHTGLPIHKVYQDKYGNCRPLYRQGMDETYEGASFMNAKIFGT